MVGHCSSEAFRMSGAREGHGQMTGCDPGVRTRHITRRCTPPLVGSRTSADADALALQRLRLSRRRYGADLLHHSEEVRLGPFADDLAVGQVVEVHGLHRDLVAGRRDPEELTVV